MVGTLNGLAGGRVREDITDAFLVLLQVKIKMEGESNVCNKYIRVVIGRVRMEVKRKVNLFLL